MQIQSGSQFNKAHGINNEGKVLAENLAFNHHRKPYLAEKRDKHTFPIKVVDLFLK